MYIMDLSKSSSVPSQSKIHIYFFQLKGGVRFQLLTIVLTGLSTTGLD